LLPSEQVLAAVGIHPIALVVWVLCGAGAVALVAVAAEIAGVDIAAVVVIGVGILIGLTAHLTWCWLACSMVVTERRLIVVRAGRRITVDSVTHPSTTDFRLQSSRLGRRLGYADVVVRFTGGGVAVKVKRVWRPEQAADTVRMIWFGDIPSPSAVRHE
jgi:hypothetical protein